MAVVTWDSANKGSNILLANGDHQVYRNSAAAGESVRTTQSMSSGKYYFEIWCQYYNGPGDSAFGFCNSSTNMNNFIGFTGTNSICWLTGGGSVWYNSSNIIGASYPGCNPANGDVIGVAIDVGAQLVWHRLNNGAWSRSGDPAAGTNGMSLSFSGPYFFAFGEAQAENRWALNAGSFPFQYAAPSGFSALGDSYTWPTGGSAFSTTNKASNLTLSNSNRTITPTNTTFGNVVADAVPFSGNVYGELTIDALTGAESFFVGIMHPFAKPNYANYGITALHLALWADNGNVYGGATNGFAFNAGDTIGIAYNLTSKLLWVRKPNGAWNVGDPVAGTGGFDLTSYYKWSVPPTIGLATRRTTSQVTLNMTGPFVLGASPWANSNYRRRFGFLLET